jgi:signal transduction histidine kinase
MNPLRPQLGGLISRLTLFYVLLSLPCLVLVESAILIFEYESFVSSVESGSLMHATERASAELASAWPSASVDEPSALGYWAQAWILRLQRPRGGLVENESYLLLELAEVPLAAAVLGPDGLLIAQAPAQSDWRPELPSLESAEFTSARQSGLAVALAGADAPYTIRRILAPVHRHDGSLRGYLFVELRLPVPWHRFLLDLSLEWPIVLGYLIVFGIASSIFLATWVTRRLNRVARAATAWSRGDFSDRIDDRSRDELGRLSGLLDRMALELKALMSSRAQLATLAERQRLARDLHDTVKQQAFALNLQLAALRRQLVADPVAAGRVGQAERLSQQMQQELAQILDELRASDAALPFAERLRARALEWAQVSHMALDLDLGDVPGIAAADQETLLRIADEALANVLRHSGATRVGLELRRQGEALSLNITDNGRGAGGDAQPGMGLANMRERAESLPNGHFVLDSRTGEGTRISIGFSANELRSSKA